MRGACETEPARYTPRMAVTVDVVVEQKHPSLPPFVVVPAAAVAHWSLAATTTVEGTLGGLDLGRRSLVRWDSDRWFIELRRGFLDTLGAAVGETLALAIHLASPELPAELTALLATDPAAAARWASFTAARQRAVREEVLAAKSSDARSRRARKALAPPPSPPPVPAALPATPRPVLLRIHGEAMPGSTCGPYSGVHVGLVEGGECVPGATVSAGLPGATWETRLQVHAADGVVRFRGPAVNGPPAERFVYLTWLGAKDGGPPAMFRRAKLRLDAVPAETLAAAVASGVLEGRVGLTMRDGMPLCASVLPPAIVWTAG